MATFPIDEVQVHEVDVDEVDDDDGGISDAELAEQAMAADPDTVAPDDAIPLNQLLGHEGPGTGDLLPGWYMPPTIGGNRAMHGWRRRMVLLIIVSFLLIDAYGLCSTYGHVGFG